VDLLMSQEDIDGALVGGASLQEETFCVSSSFGSGRDVRQAAQLQFDGRIPAGNRPELSHWLRLPSTSKSGGSSLFVGHVPRSAKTRVVRSICAFRDCTGAPGTIIWQAGG
jgi:hypothetical protein